MEASSVERKLMDTKIQIRYTPEKSDYIRASRALGMKSTGFLILAGIVILSVIGAAIVLIFPSIGGGQWKSIAVAVLLVGLFYIVYYFAIIPFQLSQSYKSNDYLRMKRELVFTDEKVMMTIKDKSSDLSWDNFTEVIDGGDFYLMIYKDKQRVYPLVPYRAFENSESQEQFLRLLESKSIKVH